jgi:hypothetical protein
LFFVDRIEKPIVADPVSPSFRVEIPEFPDIFPEMRLEPELGIEESPKFGDESVFAGAQIRLQVSLELFGLENPVLSQ